MRIFTFDDKINLSLVIYMQRPVQKLKSFVELDQPSS